MKNYLIFPMKYLNVTQTYAGKTSHLPHTTGTPKDYPVDLGGYDSGRDWVYCPCDEIKIVRIYGVGNSGTNTIWLTSTDKVIFADGTSDYVTIQFTHSNDDDLKYLKVGQVFMRDDKMFREGKDGATANHIHLSVGKGKSKGNGWAKNSNGKWVLTTTGGAIKPEKAFYVDEDFTVIKKTGGLNFKAMPKWKEYITLKKVNIRDGEGDNVGTSFPVVGTYKKGERILVDLVYTNRYGNKWAHTDKGWVNYQNLKEAEK